jgi:hypothetical protein
MRHVINNKIHLIIIYVDDLLLLTDPTEAKRLEKELLSSMGLPCPFVTLNRTWACN